MAVEHDGTAHDDAADGCDGVDSETGFLDWICKLVGSNEQAVDEGRSGGAEVQVGPGDDCAVVRMGNEDWLLKVDTVLDGVHFQRHSPTADGYATLSEVGAKAMLRTLSDIAAMGGVPLFALLSLGLPKKMPASERETLIEALHATTSAYGVAIVGGDTKSWDSEQLTVGVTLIGTMQGLHAPLRSGGHAGDRLYVTGPLGGSILGKHKQPVPRLDEGRWLAQHGATAMIDLSDGLSIDLWRLARASGCGAVITSLPISDAANERSQLTGQSAFDHALHDGEDYELLVAMPEEADPPFPLHPIGELIKIGTAELEDPPIYWDPKSPTQDDRRRRIAVRGFQHRWRRD